MNKNSHDEANYWPVFINNKTTPDTAVFEGAALSPTDGAATGAGDRDPSGGVFIETGRRKWGILRRGGFQQRERKLCV